MGGMFWLCMTIAAATGNALATFLLLGISHHRNELKLICSFALYLTCPFVQLLGIFIWFRFSSNDPYLKHLGRSIDNPCKKHGPLSISLFFSLILRVIKGERFFCLGMGLRRT